LIINLTCFYYSSLGLCAVQVQQSNRHAVYGTEKCIKKCILKNFHRNIILLITKKFSSFPLFMSFLSLSLKII